MATNFLIHNWFIIGIFLSPLAAWLHPELGAVNGYLKPIYGVAIIFLVTGLGMHPKEVLRAAGNHKLNLFILGSCFIGFPLLGWIFCKLVLPPLGINPGFAAGILILACLPITTSSCVSFTLKVKGDAAGSLFNAVASNLIGVFYAPVALTLLLSNEGQHFTLNPTPIIIQLLVIILIPLSIGLAVGKTLPKKYRQHRWVSEIVLILIVYVAFCKSFVEMNALASPEFEILKLTLALGLLHLIATLVPWIASRVMLFTNPERRSILFTAPQKTVAVGLPLAIAVASEMETSNQAFLFFPLLVYNNIQWLTAAVLVLILSNGKTPQPPSH